MSGTGRNCLAGQLLHTHPLYYSKQEGSVPPTLNRVWRKSILEIWETYKQNTSQLIPQLIYHCASVRGQGHGKKENWKTGKMKQLALTYVVLTMACEFLGSQIDTARVPHLGHLYKSSIPSKRVSHVEQVLQEQNLWSRSPGKGAERAGVFPESIFCTRSPASWRDTHKSWMGGRAVRRFPCRGYWWPFYDILVEWKSAIPESHDKCMLSSPALFLSQH